MNLLTYTETLPNGFTFDMRYIPGGTFDMGSTNEDPDAFDDEKPQRKNVSVASFYIGVFPVTQTLWKAVMGEENNPSDFIGDNRPVENVSWLDIKKFITLLNLQTIGKRTQNGLVDYCLPTEAIWEYAARGGHLNARFQYSGSDKLKEVGWFDKNSGNETHEVGKRLPNALGLYDMNGNVCEWVEDHLHENYEKAPIDERAWLTEDESSLRLLRGGGCFFVARSCRVVSRLGISPDDRGMHMGFRLAMSPSLGQSTPAIL